MSVETKTPELELLEKLNKTIETELAGKVTKAEVSDMLKSVNEAITAIKAGAIDKALFEDVKNDLEKAETLIEELQEDIAASKNNSHPRVIKSLGQMFVEKLIAEKAGNPEYWKRKDAPRIQLEAPALVPKVAGTMGTGNVDAVGTNSIPFELSDFEFGLTRIARRSPFLMQLGNVSPINTMYAQWAEQENPDGTVTAVTQGSSKPQIDFDWVEKSQKVEKIAAFIKITKEMLADLPGVRSEIDTELRELVMLKADDDLWDGDGSTPNIKGITEFATAYSEPTGLAGLVDNNYDLLRAAIAQVVENKFVPNYIVMHPTDVAGLDLIKSASDGHYLIPPFKSANGMVVSAVPIVENLGVTQGEFLVGDFTKWRIRVREGFNIDMGYDGNDFTKNLITILGEIRLASYVKGNHTGAFVLGDLLAS